MTRTNLEQAVVAAMDRAVDAPMQWGNDDCSLWCANIIQDVLGYDPGAACRGRYKTRLGAKRALGKPGLLGGLRNAARKHGWMRINPVLAQPGDIGMAWTSAHDGPVLATVICRSTGWFVGRNETGFSALRADQVAICWSVLPDTLSISPPRANLRRLSHRPEMVPSSAATQEPVSFGLSLLALFGVTGASAAVAGVVGALALTSLSSGISFIPGRSL